MKIFRISSLYILAYILFILLFLGIAYSRTETTKETRGNLLITERAFAKRPLFPKTLKSVDVDFKGISFDISRRKPVILKTSLDDVVRKSMILETSYTEDSVTLFLENNMEIEFNIDRNGEKLTINTDIPTRNVFPEISEVMIPLKVLDSHKMEKTELSYKIFNQQDEFHLKLNDNYHLTPNNEYISIKTENKKLSTLNFSHLNVRDLPIAEEWYMKHRVIKDLNMDSIISQYKESVEDHINNNYRGIRYFPSDSTWAKPPKTWDNLPSLDKVTENSSIIYLVKNMESRDYQKEYFKILGLRDRYPQKFNGKETPYIGGIVPKGKAAINEYKREITKYNTYIGNQDSRIFKERIETSYFLSDTLNRGDLEILILNRDPKTMDLEELSATLGNLLELLKSGSTNQGLKDKVKELSGIIINKIYWDKSKLYLVDNSPLSNQLLNFFTGMNLIEASIYETNEYVKPVGEALVDSFLSNRDFKGDIPLTFNSETGEFSENTIPGEDVYLLLDKDTRYPHFFTKDNITVYSISDIDDESIDIQNNINEITIKVDYPFATNNSKPHAFAISGVKPYKQIYLGGRLWRPDINFETWYIGCYYDQQAEMLFFMVNSNTREEVRITY